MFYGYPPPFGYPNPQMCPQAGPSFGNDKETLMLAKQILKQHKMDRRRKRDEEKKKEVRSRGRLFTFLETTGLILLLSIPITLLQLYMIQYAQSMMSHAFNVPTP